MVTGPLTVLSNTVLGSVGGAQTLVVHASTTLNNGLTANSATVTGALIVQGNTALGSTTAQTVTVNAVSTFQAAVTANSDMTVASPGTLTARGNVVLGSLGAGRSVTVSAATTLFNPSQAGASVTVAGTSSFAANNDVVIGTSRGNTLTVNSDSTFTGAVTGTVGVQVRAMPVTPAASPGTSIPNTYSFVDATLNAGPTNILRLPIPIMGLHIRIMAGTTKFSLGPFGSGYLINDDIATKTHTVYPNQLVDCVAVSGTKFYCSITGPVYNCNVASCLVASLGTTFSAGQNFVD